MGSAAHRACGSLPFISAGRTVPSALWARECCARPPAPALSANPDPLHLCLMSAGNAWSEHTRCSCTGGSWPCCARRVCKVQPVMELSTTAPHSWASQGEAQCSCPVSRSRNPVRSGLEEPAATRRAARSGRTAQAPSAPIPKPSRADAMSAACAQPASQSPAPALGRAGRRGGSAQLPQPLAACADGSHATLSSQAGRSARSPQHASTARQAAHASRAWPGRAMPPAQPVHGRPGLSGAADGHRAKRRRTAASAAAPAAAHPEHKHVTLLDYGAGNVRSVRNALRRLGYEVKDVGPRSPVIWLALSTRVTQSVRAGGLGGGHTACRQADLPGRGRLRAGHGQAHLPGLHGGAEGVRAGAQQAHLTAEPFICCAGADASGSAMLSQLPPDRAAVRCPEEPVRDCWQAEVARLPGAYSRCTSVRQGVVKQAEKSLSWSLAGAVRARCVCCRPAGHSWASAWACRCCTRGARRTGAWRASASCPAT